MRMRIERGGAFARGLIFGLVLGIIGASAAGALAAMNKTHWERRNWHFQSGYMAGFVDAMRIIQGRHPDTSLAREYTIPPTITPDQWVERVNQLYADTDNARRPLSQIILAAGADFAAETGYIQGGSGITGLEAFQAYMADRARRRAEEAARKAAAESGTASDGAEPEAP